MAEPKYVIHRGDGQWSALYKDGKLIKHGDHYVVDDQLFAEVGVEVETDEVWYIGDGGSNYKIAQDLDEVAEWTKERDSAKERIEALRLEAKLLEDKYKFS